MSWLFGLGLSLGIVKSSKNSSYSLTLLFKEGSLSKISLTLSVCVRKLGWKKAAAAAAVALKGGTCFEGGLTSLEKLFSLPSSSLHSLFLCHPLMTHGEDIFPFPP